MAKFKSKRKHKTFFLHYILTFKEEFGRINSWLKQNAKSVRSWKSKLKVRKKRIFCRIVLAPFEQVSFLEKNRCKFDELCTLSH